MYIKLVISLRKLWIRKGNQFTNINENKTNANKTSSTLYIDICKSIYYISGYLCVSKALRIYNFKHFMCGNVHDSKIGAYVNWCLSGHEKIYVGKFLGFAKFINISTSRIFPLIQYNNLEYYFLSTCYIRSQ